MFGRATAPKNPKSLKSNLLSADKLEGDALFEANVSELHDAVLRIAAVTGAVNAVFKGKSANILIRCRNMIPAEPTLLSVCGILGADNPSQALAVRCLSIVFRDLRPARLFLDSLIENIERKAPPHKLLRDIKNCEAEWHSVSTVALNAVNLLEPDSRLLLGGLYSENARILTKLLRSAILGEAICVDDYGYVTLPTLPKQRRLPRFALMQNCTITHRGSTYKAFAKDVSAGGLGLTEAPVLGLKAEITIQLSSGRLLKGRVVWCSDRRLGIEFLEALRPNDPLICQ